MTKLYLVTGFLGAGKTTFLKHMIRQLSGLRLRVIVNEFGREGIDGVLLRETGAAVAEINNGSIFCSCRLDQFEEVLEKAVAEPLDVIVVEASGLSDPTHVETVLSHIKTADRIAYMGGICLVDAVRFKKVFSTARVCRKQVSVSDLVLINKTDLVTGDALEAVEDLIRQMKPDALIRRTVYGQIELPWLEGFHQTEMVPSGPGYHLKDVSLQKLCIGISPTGTLAALHHFLGMFLEDTWRVKGFVRLEGTTVLVDCVGARLQITSHDGEVTRCNVLMALAGTGLPMERSVRIAAEWYPQLVESVDRDNGSQA